MYVDKALFFIGFHMFEEHLYISSSSGTEKLKGRVSNQKLRLFRCQHYQLDLLNGKLNKNLYRKFLF